MSKTFLPSFLMPWLAFLISLQDASGVDYNKTLSLVVSSRQNQTGHSIAQAVVNTEGGNVPKHWRMNMHQSNSEHQGIQSFQLVTTLVAPPPLPSDYELFPGVGYYKFHTATAKSFEDASSKCTMEGGHLAIVNSEAEHQALQTMYARHPESELKQIWAFVGFHDRKKEGEYVTIFGQPLQSTGFTRWSSQGQPDNYNGAENCGSIHRNGGLNDIGCGRQIPFFCEYDLSWAEHL
ncbi:hemolymph lipopolysaccharide-binding protein-like isoform X2 [Ischnura elegans]|uniref:hemolymph lipopolysaccharide-binding protein-like isoform X2 n=1 Tax=Ischnura elegans TaxID=197161 RepID=UPI001ED8A619|nr:hemolymph lipopolysaccharide-binding protein-like isoform X2 [Ischnura elegans]